MWGFYIFIYFVNFHWNRSCEISNYGNPAADRFEIICDLGDLVEFSWGLMIVSFAITIFYLCNLLSTRKVEWNVNKFVMNVSSCFVVTADSESYACELFGHQLVYNRGKYHKNVIFHPFSSLYQKLWFICLLCLQSFVKGLHRLYRRFLHT